MKFQINYYLLVGVILLSNISYSQHTDVENIYINATTLTSIDRTSKKLVGSSYLIKDFLPGKVSNQETIYSFRYNAYRDEMEVELDGKSYYLPLSTNYSVKFIGENKVYQVVNNEEMNATRKGFFVVVHRDDKISLFLKEKIKLYPEVPAKLGFTRYEPPVLKRIKDKFFLGIDNTAYSIPKKKKDVLKLFSGKEKDVASFIKKNKLGFKKQEDLIEIVKYYNTLK